MEALITNVDWLAVGVSTIICYLFASLWFSSWLFGKKWAEGVGVKNGIEENFSVYALVSQFFATLLLAWIVSLAVGNDSLSFIALISSMVFFFLLAANLMAGHSVYASLAEGVFVLAISIIMAISNLLLQR